jgi:YidC/Oxa1 family membrane protein insertase
MDNYRTFAIFGLLIVSLLLWEAWQNDYVRPQQRAEAALANQQSDTVSQAQTSSAATGDEQDLPALPAASLESLPAVAAVDNQSSNKIHVKTDVIDVQLSTQGADIRELALLKYPVDSKTPDVPVQYLTDSGVNFFVTQSGLRSTSTAPTHYDNYTSAQTEYVLADDKLTLSVPMVWQSEDGIKVTKTYHFKRDSYVVKVEYQVENNSGDSFSAYPYAQFNRTRGEENGSSFIYTYTGAVFSSKGNEYEKVDFGSLDDKAYSRTANNGWAAMIQHYFVAALIPDSNGQEVGYYGKSIKEKNYTAGVRMPVIAVDAGETATTEYRMYIGPKEHKRLQQVVDKLDLTVDYGILTIISDALFWVMEQIHKVTNNWGWSIVFLTILIKLAFYRLSAASYRSMASMRKLTPKLSALKERYGDDKQRFNQEMMKLYRTEKINPLGGCLPILVQMPVFLAFYWVLVESVELRQAEFMLWLNDLTAMDPYFVLPVLFGITMWFQQRLNPAPQDPAQAMVMKAFPIIFTVFFAFFPSGLVLYWFVNNLLSIAQQWHITRKLGAL